MKLIKWLNNMKSWQVFVLIFVIGCSVFFSGLTGGFQGDDTDQIIENKAVHSLSNIGLFFKSSTFWNGETLVGDFYRPMMTTTYSIIYSFFGANPMAYHVVQLLLCILGAFILYLFLKKFFKPVFALALSIIFLIHPVNSQIVYSIPSMQEPLMFLFGITALFVLTRSQTTKNIVIASGLLFLSLLSKETAVVFVCMAAIYEFLYHRDRLAVFLKSVATPVILFLILRISAVGFRNIAQSAPVDDLSLGERMIMIPSMIWFYIQKFFWPQDLATSYYWTHKTFTFEGFWLPMIFVMIILAIFVSAGIFIYKHRSKKLFTAYIFFAAWAVLGLAPYMQIIALDMTACETWIYCAFTGIIGMIAIIIRSIKLKFKVKPIFAILLILPLLIILGWRTSVRGLDFHSQETLSLRDIAVTEKNYLAMNNLAKYYIDNGDPKKAEYYAEKSIEYFPAVSNYINLGVIRQKQQDFVGARVAYTKALKLVPLRVVYENLAIVNLTDGESTGNIKFLEEALKIYPNNNRLWNYMAIEQAAVGNQEQAKIAILNAYRLGTIPPKLYEAIMNKTPLDIPMPDSDRIIKIRWE